MAGCGPTSASGRRRRRAATTRRHMWLRCHEKDELEAKLMEPEVAANLSFEREPEVVLNPRSIADQIEAKLVEVKQKLVQEVAVAQGIVIKEMGLLSTGDLEATAANLRSQVLKDVAMAQRSIVKDMGMLRKADLDNFVAELRSQTRLMEARMEVLERRESKYNDDLLQWVLTGQNQSDEFCERKIQSLSLRVDGLQSWMGNKMEDSEPHELQGRVRQVEMLVKGMDCVLADAGALTEGGDHGLDVVAGAGADVEMLRETLTHGCYVHIANLGGVASFLNGSPAMVTDWHEEEEKRTVKMGVFTGKLRVQNLFP